MLSVSVCSLEAVAANIANNKVDRISFRKMKY
jgi:hypothetical protein